MRTLQRLLVSALVLLASSVTVAGDLPAPARIEVEGLLSALGSSQCEFYRNGSWYEAAEAQQHLRKKYDYLLKKGMISSAEEFILKGASQSSMSGEIYQVRCPDVKAQPSADWLKSVLKKMREGVASEKGA